MSFEVRFKCLAMIMSILTHLMILETDKTKDKIWHKKKNSQIT